MENFDFCDCILFEFVGQIRGKVFEVFYMFLFRVGFWNININFVDIIDDV